MLGGQAKPFPFNRFAVSERTFFNEIERRGFLYEIRRRGLFERSEFRKPSEMSLKMCER